MAKYCPDCGTPTKRRILSGRERDTCPTCGFVQFARAKSGVGALVFRGDTVLLVERNIPPHGIWTLPSGHQEENETLEMAVVREVREETGLKITPRGIVYLRNMMEHSAVDTYCVFICDSILDEAPVAGDAESSAAKFVSVENFDSIKIEPDSRWFIENYLTRKPEYMKAMENPFEHPSLQIYSVAVKGAL